MDLSQYPQLEWVVRLIHDYSYPVLVPIAWIEGPWIMLVSGFLIKLGVLSFWPAFIALSIGDFIGDIWWYRVGYTLGASKVAEKYGKKFGATMPLLQRMGQAFQRHQTLVLIVSKLTAGFGFSLITLIAAGAYRISFRRYLLINGLGQFLWTLVPVGAGYFFGQFFEQISSTASRVVIIIILCCLASSIFYFVLPYFGKNVRDKVAPE